MRFALDCTFSIYAGLTFPYQRPLLPGREDKSPKFGSNVW